MNFYTAQHEFYRGIDLHAKRMFTCVVGRDGEVVLHRNLKTQPNDLLDALKPWRDRDFVVGVESTSIGIGSPVSAKPIRSPSCSVTRWP